MSNLSFTVSQGLKDALLNGDVDFGADTFNAILMRAGFSYSNSRHLLLKNVQASAAITYDVDASVRTLTRSSGSFITDGFVVGNYLTVDAGANSANVFQIASVASATVLRLTEISGTIVSETSQTNTWSTDDEMATGSGYTHGGFTVTFTVDSGVLDMVTIDLSTGGNFGTAARTGGFLIYDDTYSVGGDNDLVVAHARFSDWRLGV
jgi:hypothetical protein